MASEYVHEIQLINSVGYTAHVPVKQPLDLPDILHVDCRKAPYPAIGGDFKLVDRVVSPAPHTISVSHVTTARYAQYQMGPNDMSVCLNYIMFPNTPMPLLAATPTWQTITHAFNTVPLIYSKPFTLDFGDSLLGYAEEVTASREPECRCDMRMLMSAEHPAGCPWMVWKRKKSAGANSNG